MKIVEYQVVFAEAFSDFLSQMNIFIKDGWQPVGGYTEDKNGHPNQAMVKYEEEKVFLSGMPCPPIKMDIEDQAFLNEVITENERLKKEIKLLKMSPETVSYFERLEDDDLSKLKFKLYVSDKSIEALQKENELLQSRIRELLKQNGELEWRLSELAKESYKAINEVQQLKKENEKLNSELIKLTEENRILNENNC